MHVSISSKGGQTPFLHCKLSIGGFTLLIVPQQHVCESNNNTEQIGYQYLATRKASICLCDLCDVLMKYK